jgi:hypothetical protein
MLGDVPARIGDEVIGALRERLPHLNVLDDRGEILEAGDRVAVTSGPLAGLEAVFDQRLSDDGRARMLVKLLEGSS